MIAKLIKGKGFRGALEYDLREEKGLLLDTNMAGETPRELAREFGEIRALRPNLNNAVCHISVSIAPDECFTDEQWRAVAQKTLVGMGFQDCQHVVTKHEDTMHPHIHILANRVTMNGEAVADSHDYKRLEGIMRTLEKEYDLREVVPSEKAKRRAPTKGEIECAVRTGRPSEKMIMQELVDKAIQDKPDLKMFRERLEKQGVALIPNMASTGRISGISYRHNEITMKGSDLGKGYSWGGLQKRGLTYEQNRDAPTVGREQHGPTIERPGRSDGNDRGDSREESQGRGRIGAITRTLAERHAQNNLGHGAELGRIGPERQIHQKPTRGGHKNMESSFDENRSARGRDTEFSVTNSNGGSGNSGMHQGDNATNKDREPTAAMGELGVSPGGGGADVSALDRFRALADAGLRYAHPQPRRDLRIAESGGGEDSGFNREEMIERKKERKKEVDMER